MKYPGIVGFSTLYPLLATLKFVSSDSYLQSSIGRPALIPLRSDPVAPHLLGRGLRADVEAGRGQLQRQPLLQYSFCYLLSTINRQSSILVVVHSVSSEITDSSQNQLLAVRSNGLPIDTSQLELLKD